MSDSAENKLGSDIEAQGTLSERSPTGSAEKTTNFSMSMPEAFRKLVLILCSLGNFKSGPPDNSAADITSASVKEDDGGGGDDNLYNESSDVEAQPESPLLERSTRSSEAETTTFNPRKVFRRAGLYVRSAQVFMSGAKFAATDISSPLISSASYQAITIPDEEEPLPQNPHVESSEESFDVAARQESALLEMPVESAEAETTSFDAKRTFRRAALYIHSVRVFRSGVKSATDISSPLISSTSKAISAHQVSSIMHMDSSLAATSSEFLEVSSQVTSISNCAPSQHEHHITLFEEMKRKHITHKIVRKKNFQALCDFGGVRGIAEALKSDPEKGISGPTENLEHKSIQSCLRLVTLIRSLRAACNKHTILLCIAAACNTHNILLFIIAACTTGFGIKEAGWHVGWVNGVIFASVAFLIFCFTAIQKLGEEISKKWLENDLRLNGMGMQVQVVREGRDPQLVSESDLQVGDLAVLKEGDYVPADGVFVTGQVLEIDEDEGLSTYISIDEENPFLFYGSRVINGVEARMLVTSTRMDTAWGERMIKTMQDSPDKENKFESRLHELNTYIGTIGILQSILTLIVQFVLYRFGKDDEHGNMPDLKGASIKPKPITDELKVVLTATSGKARALIALLSFSLVGITEMSLVTAVAATIWSRMILAHKALVRDFLAPLTMGSVTIICTDNIGELAVVGKFYVGQRFISESSAMAPNVLEGLCDGIGTLSLQGLHNDCESKLLPLTSWAESRSGVKKKSMIEQCNIKGSPVGLNPFEGCCQVVIEKIGKEGLYMHCRGPLQNVLPLCSHYYGIEGDIHEIDRCKVREFEQANGHMTANEAEVVTYAYKRMDSFSAEPSNLILLAMISLKKTKIEETKQAISTLRDSGIQTILLSGNDLSELKHVGANCGILTPHNDNWAELKAETFRGWSNDEKINNAEKIQIMGNCLPSDKIDLIQCLRKKDQVVAFLGQSMMDVPALKQANIGITKGTRTSPYARESSDIIIWEDNCFSFLVYAVENGRCFQENIRKFIQLELISTGSSMLINFFAIVSLRHASITLAEFLGLNLAILLFGGLALLIGPSTKEQTTMLTTYSSKNLMTKEMYRNIALQVIYQTAIFIMFLHKVHAIPGMRHDQVRAMIWKGFFICQVFSIFTAREPQKKNIFIGLFHKNMWFWVGSILLLISVGMNVELKVVFGSSPGWSWEPWVVFLVIGLGSWVMDFTGKCLW